MLRRIVFFAGLIVVLAAMAMPAAAQPGPGGGGMFGGGSGAMLLGIAEVQTELGLTSDQKTEVTTLLTDAREKMRATFGQTNRQELQGLSQEERQKRFDEMRKKAEEANKGLDEKITKILKPEQSTRFKQLQFQRQGARALTTADVIAKLKISDDQGTKIKKILADARPTGGRAAFDPNQTAEERQANMKKMREQMEKAQKECFAVLSDDQMLDWTNMCGKTFKFPEFQGRGPRNPPAQQ
jgi:hypothetical protein